MKISSKPEKDSQKDVFRKEQSQLTNIVSFSGGLLGEKKKRKREAISHPLNSLSMEMIVLMCVFMGEMHISHMERKRYSKVKE